MCRQELGKLKKFSRVGDCVVSHAHLWALQHHCRNCGQSVCDPCSSKRLSLPHYSIQESTRVCDVCFKKLDKSYVDRQAHEMLTLLLQQVQE